MRVRLVHQAPVFVSATATTDANGSFRISGVGAGSYSVALDPSFPIEAAAGFSDGGERYVADGSDVLFAPIQTAKVLVITEPLPGGTLAMPVTVRWQPVDRAAKYTAHIRDASYRILASQDVVATQATLSAPLAAGGRYWIHVDALGAVSGGFVLIAWGRDVDFTAR